MSQDSAQMAELVSLLSGRNDEPANQLGTPAAAPQQQHYPGQPDFPAFESTLATDAVQPMPQGLVFAFPPRGLRHPRNRSRQTS
jgi:hypothetical protein